MSPFFLSTGEPFGMGLAPVPWASLGIAGLLRWRPRVGKLPSGHRKLAIMFGTPLGAKRLPFKQSVASDHLVWVSLESD